MSEKASITLDGNTVELPVIVGTENEKMKEYKQMDTVVMDKNSKEYILIETYQNLDLDAQNRLVEYAKALLEK